MIAAVRSVEPTATHRVVAISDDGELIALRDWDETRIIDAATSGSPVGIPPACDFVWIGRDLWTTDGQSIRVYDASGVVVDVIDVGSDNLLPAPSADAVIATDVLLKLDGDSISTASLGSVEDETIIAFLGGLRTLRARGPNLRITDPDREVACFRLLQRQGKTLRATPILGATAVAVVSSVGDDLVIDTLKITGARIHRLEIPQAREVSIAPTRGIALVTTTSGEARAFDLRYGRLLEQGPLPLTDCSLAVDANAQYVAVASLSDSDRAEVYRLRFEELFGEPLLVSENAPRAQVVVPLDQLRPAGETPRHEPPIPSGPLLALGQIRGDSPSDSLTEAVPYDDPLDHLDALAELAIARAALVLSERTDELYVTDHARTAINNLAQRAEELAAAIAGRVEATLARGGSLPLHDVAAEFELDLIERDVIAVVAAPAVEAHAAKLYAMLAADDDRSFCDRALIVEILGKRARRALSRQSILFRAGLLEEAASTSELFAHVTVSIPLLDRLRGLAVPSPNSATTLVTASKPLERLTIPRDSVVDLVRALQAPHEAPARVVVRGRDGSGRTDLLAALADRAGRAIALIDLEQLPSGERFAAALRLELSHARILGAIPCIANLDARANDDRAPLRQVFRKFEAPLLFRASLDFELPLDSGYYELAIPALNESARLAYWRQSLADAGLDGSAADELALRTRLGPAAIDAVVARAAERHDSGDPASHLRALASQHIDSRLGTLAHRIDRLGTWDQLALDPDTLDAVRELVGRARHRRTVFDDWGFDAKLSTSRGLAALFSGPPGTGKTLVAGIVARELGLDLYRVDLASLVSKWIGETEKNLARLFDAAADAQVVLLFDEADALFSKRTDVKSSNDRHANMETGYLLQRLDSFEGVAILTTNLSKSIDKAVSRRLAMKIDFPFPDDETRVALWRAHLPERLPTAGDLELERIARDYPMTGGYVRNCALRAAFLAAADRVVLTSAHLERAIHLEYTQAGRISPSGRLE